MKVKRKVSALLGKMARDERDKILAQCDRRRYAKGDQIVRELDWAEHNMYFIDHGAVRVTLYGGNGREVSFATLGQGENFGEISAIDGRPRSATVIALTETEITIMSSQVFWRLLGDYPKVARELLQQMSATIRRLCDRIFEYSTIGVNNRIHAELLRLARKNLDLDGIARIIEMPTHAQLASRVSCHREAVSRELKALEKRGIVVKSKRKFIISDIDRLQTMVDQVMRRSEDCYEADSALGRADL